MYCTGIVESDAYDHYVVNCICQTEKCKPSVIS